MQLTAVLATLALCSGVARANEVIESLPLGLLELNDGIRVLSAGNSSIGQTPLPNADLSSSLQPRDFACGSGSCRTGALCCYSDYKCYPSSSQCCAFPGACDAGRDCCVKGCIPAGTQCCSTGDYCYKGNHCYRDDDTSANVCCTDSKCTAAVQADGSTKTLTRYFTFVQYWTLYSTYYIGLSTRYTTFYSTTTFYISATATAQASAIYRSSVAVIGSSLSSRYAISTAASTAAAARTTSSRSSATITAAPDATDAAVGGADPVVFGSSDFSLPPPARSTTTTRSTSTSSASSQGDGVAVVGGGNLPGAAVRGSRASKNLPPAERALGVGLTLVGLAIGASGLLL